MNTLIKLLVVCSIICSCTEVRYAESVERNERENITSNTVVVNMKSNEYEDVVLLSDIIKDVKYLDLEDTEESSLYPTKNIKVIDSLIYIQDIEDQLKCFDIQGRFQRNTYRRGNGPDEVVKFYDYDVDDTYLYILDGALSAVLIYAHDGHFVKRKKLPFRAIRLKRLENGNFLFELSPYTLENDNEDYSIVLTDSSFQVKNKFIERTKVCITRTPFFENQTNSTYFAPIFRRGIYEIKGDSLYMKFYLDFDTPYYEQSRDVNGDIEARDNNIFYTYENPMHTDKYLLQKFTTSKSLSGLFIMDLNTENSIFVRNIKNDMDNIYNFDFIHTKYYDQKKNLFVGIPNVYYREFHADNEIKEASMHLSDSIASILIKDGIEEKNKVLMFYQLQDDIIERIEHKKSKT